ncbi:GDSL-type esterase/lipase family protein [Nonomuraea sp. NBC_00507]|uniref:SGNH/GDSL hydrolase family protein n=1 Tax=Nonomuraea sp. NBC_00507 TaxID=2976002 RepID=UPI002E18DD13
MRPLRLTAVLAALVAAMALPGTAGAAVPQAPASGVLVKAHTAGRVKVAGDSVQYSWPGVSFEGRFRGTGVGITLNDYDNDYDVEVDGATVATLVTPGRTTYWVNGLTRGVHRVRLVKRTESPWATSAFGGFVAAPGGVILGKPAARHRQIEFIGDSYTVGYGNRSDSRDCTNDKLHRTTDANLSFGALTARRLNADYQINAFSGLGMVRNYNGSNPQVTYRTYYDRALLNVDGDVWQNPGTWRPQLVVVGLGINDFSTAINPGEQWTPETLAAAYRTAYHAFLDKLRAQYGPGTMIVVSATYMSNTTVFAETAQRIVQERNSSGDDRVRYWYYSESGLDYMGCHWHPSVHDHQIIAERLDAFIATLPLRW